jgi:hypothetical protein
MWAHWESLLGARIAHMRTPALSDPSLFVSKGPLVCGWVHPSHRLCDRDNTANSWRVKTLHPWKQIETILFLIDVLLFVPQKCLQWEREARSSATESKLTTGSSSWLRLPRLLPNVLSTWFWWCSYSVLLSVCLLGSSTKKILCSAQTPNVWAW